MALHAGILGGICSAGGIGRQIRFRQVQIEQVLAAAAQGDGDAIRLEIDGKRVFGFEGRGIDKRLTIDARHDLSETDLNAADKAASYCPTGSLVRKREGWKIPVGSRKYDKEPIGTEIEGKRG